jgi:hypothetical protein
MSAKRERIGMAKTSFEIVMENAAKDFAKKIVEAVKSATLQELIDLRDSELIVPQDDPVSKGPTPRKPKRTSKYE